MNIFIGAIILAGGFTAGFGIALTLKLYSIAVHEKDVILKPKKIAKRNKELEARLKEINEFEVF